jgi:cardiolipin synthase
MSGYGEGSRTSNSQNDDIKTGDSKSGIGKSGGSSTDA